MHNRVANVNTYDLFMQAMQRMPRDKIAISLGLNPNTIARWQERKEVPHNYTHDFMRVLGKKIHIAQDTVRDKDQFFTKPEVVQHCFKKLNKVASDLKVNLSNYCFIEPSAGCGHFYENLPKNKRIGIDIDPKMARKNGLVSADYLSWTPPEDSCYIVVGNPPFGLRGHLALQFINHSAKFADIVAFILPQLFYSDGKGAPRKRVKGYDLAYNEPLAADSFQYPNGSAVNVSTVFQVWTKINVENIKLPEIATCVNYIRVYSLSDGGTPSSTRNKKMLYECDVYLPSTCFSGMKAYRNFEDLPHRRGYGVVIRSCKRDIKKILFNNDWQKTAFPSTNGALNLRRSLIEGVVTKEGYKDERLT